MAHFDARDLSLDIDKQELKRLYKTRPLVHAAHMAFNWLIILGIIIISVNFFNPLLYVLAVIIIGARMHALAILMHDATHFRFLKNKKWNDRLSNFLTMYPLYTSIEKYRTNHLRHHLKLNTEEDPDWVAKIGKKDFEFPQSKQEFLRTVASYFFLYKGISDAIWFLKRFGPGKNKNKKGGSTTWKSKIPVLSFWAVLITVLSVMGWWPIYLMYWLVPYLSTFFMFQYIRSVAEHFGDLSYDHLLTSTRTTKPNGLEKFFIAPHNVGYHLEHHLYPGVPYYNLPELHNMLMKFEEFAGKAHITRGYVEGLLNDIGHEKLQIKTA